MKPSSPPSSPPLGPRKRPSLQVLRLIAKLSKYGFILAFLLSLLAWHKQGRLPGSAQIASELAADPTQVRTQEAPFDFEYRGTEYTVEPQAQYEIQGLIVSHNNIHAWWDIYHDENSVDIKDLCIAWGDNLQDELHTRVEFTNHSFTCYWRIPSAEDYRAFRPEQASNNHLLSDSESVRRAIREARVGDQIRMRGWLVNYYPSGQPNYKRASSLSRHDTAGFACEVLFVNEFDFIARAPRVWFSVHENSRTAAWYLFCTWLLLALALPYLEYRYE
jgi:hypothetical protein